MSRLPLLKKPIAEHGMFSLSPEKKGRFSTNAKPRPDKDRRNTKTAEAEKFCECSFCRSKQPLPVSYTAFPQKSFILYSLNILPLLTEG